LDEMIYIDTKQRIQLTLARARNQRPTTNNYTEPL